MIESGNTDKQAEKALFEGSLIDVKYCATYFTGLTPWNNFYEVDIITTYHSTEEKPEAWNGSNRVQTPAPKPILLLVNVLVLSEEENERDGGVEERGRWEPVPGAYLLKGQSPLMTSVRHFYNISRNVLLRLSLVWIACSYLLTHDSYFFLLSGKCSLKWPQECHMQQIVPHGPKGPWGLLTNPPRAEAGERAQVQMPIQTSVQDASSARRNTRRRSLLKTRWNRSLHFRAEVHWRADGATLQSLRLNVTSDNLHSSFLALQNNLSVPAFTVEVNG